MHSQNKSNADNAITPENSVLLLIDYQSLILLGIQSHDRTLLTNNIVGLARAARAFDVPTVLTTVNARSFGGPFLPELRGIFPDLKTRDRTIINAWEDENFVAAVKETRRKTLIIAGLWTEMSLALPVLSALEDGCNVYFAADASGSVNPEAHQLALQQLIQAGARPRTWQQVMFAWQRDWACLETVDAVREIISCHGGAFPQSLIYGEALSGGREARTLQAPRRGIQPVGMGR